MAISASIRNQLIDWAEKFNDPVYFCEDPIAFPRSFLSKGASLQDIEIAAVFSAHFAWGRRSMIVRDLERLFDFMEWKPREYIEAEDYRNDEKSAHRTIKWSDVADICRNLKSFYAQHSSLEQLSTAQIREQIFSQKPDPKAANKKINMMRRWMVRHDGKVDLGLWKNLDPRELIIPLDIHVYTQALELGLTSRRAKDLATALEITESLREVFPNDPLLGDFALFGYGVAQKANNL